MAAQSGQITITTGRSGRVGSAGVAGGVVLYEGTLCYQDGDTGFATDVRVDADTVFLAWS